MTYYVMYRKEWKDGTVTGGVMDSFTCPKEAYDYLDECEKTKRPAEYYVQRIK
ncbi:hypothetical protein BH780_gp117 [Bacillus phage Eldridge]|uniref:Uncharacterized protein n=1 Tax=Bacillus phage Eldridge TaxID=1776293 RepID=A0A120HUP4_9CAUD|nr:hypothetical protein BH780_gp117 [Bacillus phage Eldridge]AMB18700.1 hypothetical protein Eldridge_0120 [Bacillus phage Eldridge]